MRNCDFVTEKDSGIGYTKPINKTTTVSRSKEREHTADEKEIILWQRHLQHRILKQTYYRHRDRFW